MFHGGFTWLNNRRQNESQYRSPRLLPFFSATIREGRVALSVGHPRETHSRYVIGFCLIPLGVSGLKNNSRRITYGIGYVWGMPSLFPLSSLVQDICVIFFLQSVQIWQPWMRLQESSPVLSTLDIILNQSCSWEIWARKGKRILYTTEYMDFFWWCSRVCLERYD